MKTLRLFAASTIVLFIVFGVWYASRVTDWSDWHEWASMALLCFAVLNSCLLYKAAKE